MSTRRPRIKPVANIGAAKRKIKSEVTETKNTTSNETENSIKTENPLVLKGEIVENSNTAPEDLKKNFKEEASFFEAAKPIAENKNNNEQLQKPRQRIRPTPCFDTRRNSITNSNSHISSPQTPVATPGSPFSSPHENYETKSNESLAQKKNTQHGNRTPNVSRMHRTSESSNGGFMSPTYSIQNSPSFSLNHSQHHHISNQSEMNSLCSPPPRDHIPPRYRKISSMEDSQRLTIARKDFQLKYSRKTPEKSALKLADFIFYNPPSNPMVFETKQEKIEIDGVEISDKENSESGRDESKDTEIDSMVHEEERAPVPKLKLDSNGEIIIDEKSLVIETTAEKQARAVLASSKSAIYVDEYSGNNGFYSRQKRTKDWAPEETLKFYKCLHTIGTDFSMMLSLFPNRDRRDLKLKFKKEERANGDLVNKALLKPKAFDIATLTDELREEEENCKKKLRIESEKKLKIQKKSEEKMSKFKEAYVQARAKNKNFYSRAGNSLSNGDLAYQMEDALMAPKKRKTKNKTQEDMDKILSTDMNYLIKDCQPIVKEDKTLDEEEKECESNENSSCLLDVEYEDLMSVNSNTNEFGYDESSGVEITDIGDILDLGDSLPEAEDSTLAIVSKHDKMNPDNVTHGIYIICRSTGIMSQKPLDLPGETVNCILKAMGKI